MSTLALRVASQRNTQYQELASALAPAEVRLSPLGGGAAAVESRSIGDAEYLIVEGDDLDESVLSLLAATSDTFAIDGDAWHPIPVTKAAAVPRTMIETRRYQGKTNEMLTRLLVNLALFERWPSTAATTRILDPLCGGGTTLFAALERGCSVIGADRDKNVVEGTAQYLRQFCKEHRISSVERAERVRSRGKVVGKQWHRTIRGDHEMQVSLLPSALADLPGSLTTIPGGAKAHAIVADLPYGIQHRGQAAEVVSELLTVGRTALTGDGVVVFAWNASTFDRDALLEDVDLDGFAVQSGGAYDELGHRVDRVIKRRDVAVLRVG